MKIYDFLNQSNNVKGKLDRVRGNIIHAREILECINEDYTKDEILEDLVFVLEELNLSLNEF